MAIRITIPCSECDGHGVYSIVSSTDPSAKLYDCEVCDGTGQARCSECDEPATELRHVECKPPLVMPLCARHAAEYAAEELV